MIWIIRYYQLMVAKQNLHIHRLHTSNTKWWGQTTEEGYCLHTTLRFQGASDLPQMETEFCTDRTWSDPAGLFTYSYMQFLTMFTHSLCFGALQIMDIKQLIGELTLNNALSTFLISQCHHVPINNNKHVHQGVQ